MRLGVKEDAIVAFQVTEFGAAELKAEFHGISEADLSEIPAAALGFDGDGTAADVVQRERAR